MTIREAHVEWGREKNNAVFYSRTRGLFEKAFGGILEHLTCMVSGNDLQRILASASLCYEDKVKVASVMEHVMKYAHEHEPDKVHAIHWDYNDLLKFSNDGAVGANGANEEDGMNEVTDLCKCGNTNIRKARMKSKAKEKMKRVRKAVLQLDPDLDIIINEFGSIGEAEKTIGIKNIARAIKNNGTAGGYRWKAVVGNESPVADAAGTVAVIAPAGPGHDAASMPQQTCTDGEVPTTEPPKAEPGCERKAKFTRLEKGGLLPVKCDLSSCSNQELLDEIRRRGWKGNVEFMASLKL